MRAKTHCDLLLLSKKNIIEITQHFPESEDSSANTTHTNTPCLRDSLWMWHVHPIWTPVGQKKVFIFFIACKNCSFGKRCPYWISHLPIAIY